MPPKIIDEFTNRNVSRQRKHQMRKARDKKQGKLVKPTSLGGRRAQDWRYKKDPQ